MAIVFKQRGTEELATQRHARIGEILLRAGLLEERDVPRVVVRQRQDGILFGEAARRLGLIEETDVRHALARQFDYPYIAGREFALARGLVAAHEPFGGQAELLRTLRSQLNLRWFRDHQKALAIVAPRSGSGCSTLAANLAIVFSQLGERTLLVDANLRCPSQQQLFAIPDTDGLSTLLAGRGSLDELLTPIAPFSHLWLLGAGPAAPNPQELLSQLTFAYLLETLPARFDVVIVDTPPALDFADAQIIAGRCGGCLLVARRHQTRYSDLEKTGAQIEPSGARSLGAVLT